MYYAVVLDSDASEIATFGTKPQAQAYVALLSQTDGTRAHVEGRSSGELARDHAERVHRPGNMFR